MTSLTLAALLGVTSLSHGWYEYTVASDTAVRSDRELLVLISADWCGACRKLKQQLGSNPQLKPLLEPYLCTVVDVDRQPELARALGGQGGIPLLIAYSKTPRGWVRREMRGYQSVRKLTEFLRSPSGPPVRPYSGANTSIALSLSTLSPRSDDGASNARRRERPKAIVQLLGIVHEETSRTDVTKKESLNRVSKSLAVPPRKLR